MKKILLLATTVALFGLFGCEKNESNVDNNGSDNEITLDGYKEPVTDFGISVSQLKSIETHSLQYQEGNVVGYKGENMVELYIYTFDDSDMLAASGAVLNALYADQIGEFLAQKYRFVYTDSTNFRIYYVSKDLKMSVVVQILNTTQILIAYLPYDNSDSIATGISDVYTKMANTVVHDNNREIFDEIISRIK